MISEQTKAHLRRFMEVRDARDAANKAAETAEKAYRDMEADVYEEMKNSGVKGSIKVDLGDPWGVTSFSTRETFFGRIVDKDAALAYYEDRAMIEEVSEPKFVMKRINDEVRDALEQASEMPPGHDWYARRGITITRQKA